MLLRISAFLVLLFSILFLPFWLSLVLAFGGMMYFKVFLEAPALFLLSDLLFGAPESRFSNFIFLSLSISVALILFAEFLKKKLKFYP